ncbi:MAG TPA: diguanylate cyclase [Solirubrobacteraceae bacterium]|jgi:diguanylate cyclase (GGDEF)-like protein|nr:diguanylate cyclase [Solirubrobacteraceae bacterium]
MTSVMLRLVRSTGGAAAVAELLARAGVQREPSYLENVENWISLDEATAMFQAGVELTGDQLFARRVGENTLRQHAGTQVATVLRSLGSTEAVLQAVAQSTARISAVTQMEAIEAMPGRGVVRACAREGFTRRRLHCDWTTGLLAGLPILFGLPLARVEESECQTRGDSQCLYTVSWDAELAATAADPQQRVTSLEAQLVAMSERLNGAYATAGDLVSTDDLDTVLRRIVERAADAVRAPSHILAVRTDPSAELQVYSRGIDEGKAQQLATATLAQETPVGESTLVVDVASARRQYGQLIARYPGVVEFFPQDHEVLSLYAKHAAAVLDMSVALEQSTRRHEQVSALLSLSSAVAQAGTSDEVAERLVAVVPEVVDCDRTGVWLWDYLEQNLRSLAMSGRTAQQDEYLRELVISVEDTPYLRDMIAVPEVQFFDDQTEDPFMRGVMERLGVVALTTVPIIARDIFLGVLTVSVTEDPRRLRSDGELVERLTGVAALAATAIQNGQLVDKLRHKASHDALTGLLNRVGFRQHIDRILDSGRPALGHVGLLFVDLDEFKHVNDAYGHDVGDELIRKAAHRLEETARAGDGVARLGGDEFAIILADVREHDQLRAAQDRVRSAFREPFMLEDVTISVGASVGGAMWPENGQTVNELVNYADAAMYEDKAKHRSSAMQV